MVSEMPIAERLGSEGLKWLSLQQRLATELLEVRELDRKRDAAEKAVERAVDKADQDHKEQLFSAADDALLNKRDGVRVTLRALIGVPFERLEDANL